jgi:OOP family OmpA-OmpF porin
MKQVCLTLILFAIFCISFADAQHKGSDRSDSVQIKNYKLFGGYKQYNTWSIGVNVGATSPMLATGGSSDFNGNVVSLGYGISVKDQLSHLFGVQFDLAGGQVAGTAVKSQGPGGFITGPTGLKFASFVTNFWQTSFSGIANIATIDFLNRKNAITFYAKAGLGMAYYKPAVTEFPTGALDKYPNTVTNLVVPVGTGVKFRMTDNIALNIGYTENFIDGDNFDGVNYQYPTADRYSYGYAGAIFTLGPKSKANIDWVNPVAQMYDELYDKKLRLELAALTKQTTKVENAVKKQQKDTDGDGVSDQFDKCPNTPAGTIVDGSGCPIKLPPPIDTSVFMRKGVDYGSVPARAAVVNTTPAFTNIQFEPGSAMIPRDYYDALNATVVALKSSGSSVIVNGYTSSEGTSGRCRKLSLDRANSVKRFLVNGGVDGDKIKIKAFGRLHPIGSNYTHEGRALNRRVELKKEGN